MKAGPREVIHEVECKEEHKRVRSIADEPAEHGEEPAETTDHGEEPAETIEHGEEPAETTEH